MYTISIFPLCDANFAPESFLSDEKTFWFLKQFYLLFVFFAFVREQLGDKIFMLLAFYNL